MRLVLPRLSFLQASESKSDGGSNMKYLKAKRDRVTQWLAMHIVWFTFHDTTATHERIW
jgi:hypothetical protein